MFEPPLSVAVASLIKNRKILLIKRLRGDYVGFLALPGGKIEKHEHLSQAVVREIREESGIESVFTGYLGTVSELMMENGQVLQHFLLHVCELDCKDTGITSKDDEGILDWYNLDRISDIKDRIIPSDYMIIEQIIKNHVKNYYDCIVEKTDTDALLTKFE